MSHEHMMLNEISELFSNPENIQRDLREAFKLMKEYMHGKYMEKMMKVVRAYQANSVNNPSAEISFLRSWMPFIPPESHRGINELTGMLETARTLSELRAGLSNMRPVYAGDNKDSMASRQTQAHSSLHKDGVYDIDELCKSSTHSENRGGFENMAMLIFMLNLANKQDNYT